MNHLINIEYDSAGYPLVNKQIQSLGQTFDVRKQQIKIGKIRKFDDGTVEFMTEKSEKRFDVLPSPQINFKREIVSFDDDNQTFTQLGPIDHQYSTCLNISD